MMLKFSISFILLCLVSIVLGRSANGHYSQNILRENSQKSTTITDHGINKVSDVNSNKNNNNNNNNNDFWNDLRDLYKVYQQCSEDNLAICLKIKLLTSLEKVTMNEKDLKLFNGIEFVKDTNSEKEFKSVKRILSEREIEASLPRSLEDKDQVLNNLIFDKVLTFLKSHTLQIKVPPSSELARSFMDEVEDEEGRGKKKGKKNQAAYIMIPLLIKGFIVPLAFGALSLLAGKALIVSKLALVLASIIGIKKLLSHGPKETQHEVVVASGGHGSSGWGRDIDLAYNAYDFPEKQKQF